MAASIPSNQARFSPAELSAALNVQTHLDVKGVSTDTRTIAAGNLFVALRGESFDGHDHIAAALAKGAVGVLVERDMGERPSTIRVPNALAALGQLAHFHRKRWARSDPSKKLLGIGGSVGKTTTTKAISALLKGVAPGEVHHTPGNLNNQIGVPMTLLGLCDQHRYAVVELGTSILGEMAILMRMAEPDAALLTTITLEHPEGLGDLASIEQEEGVLLGMLAPGATAFGQGDDEAVMRVLKASPALSKITYGKAPQVDFRLVATHPEGLGGQRLHVARKGSSETLSFVTPLLGIAGQLATMAALAAVETLTGKRIEPSAIEAALKTIDQGDGRLSVSQLSDGTIVIDDTYNANPASMRSALGTAASLAAGRRLICVLGEMRELGDFAEREHRALGEVAAGYHPQALYALTGNAHFIANAASARGVHAAFFEDAPALIEVLLKAHQAQDVVLVKASRGVKAERVVEALKAQLNKGAS